MYKIDNNKKLEIVHYYLKNSTTLMETAQKFGVHYQSVFKWIKMYKKMQNNSTQVFGYKRPWNRFSKEIEEKVALLKEKNPDLSIRKAKKILEREGIKISIKGIWNIWKRYGYTGFKKQELSSNFTSHCVWTPEAVRKFETAKFLFEQRKVKKCAEILNTIPMLPKNELILLIPDNLLNIPRRVEKIALLFGKIPIHKYLKKVRTLYKECEKKQLYYSCLKIGLHEIIVLQWLGKPKEQIKKIKELKFLIKSFHKIPLYIRLSLTMQESIAYFNLLKIQKADEATRLYETLIKRQKEVSPHFLLELGTLYGNLRNFSKAEYWYTKALEKSEKDKIKYYLAQILILKGKYKKGLQILNSIKLNAWGIISNKLLFRALYFLYKGMPQKALFLSINSISLLKKEQIKAALFKVYFTISSIYCSLGEKTKAKKMIKEVSSVLERNKNWMASLLLKNLITERPNNFLFQSQIQDSPPLKLLSYIKKENYIQALAYAERMGLISYFHRYILFFPEIVYNRIRKGKPTYLPKSLLKLPVFNKEAFVFAVRFLGKLKVHRSYGIKESKNLKELLKLNLTPKEKAFLIHLALKLPKPGRTIPLEKIYKNFWKNSQKPSRNLSHLLSKIRKQLKIPVHLLEISRHSGYQTLKNNGIYFLTDYLEFKEITTRAKALLKAEEYKLAKKELKSALKLIRGEPFKKMYDRWSEDKRTEILFEIESTKEEFEKLGSRYKENKKEE